MHNHPTMCGRLMFAMDRTLRTSGLHYCSDIGNVIAMARLYQAARHNGSLAIPWTDMDVLITTCGEEHLFVGTPPLIRRCVPNV